MRWKAAKLASSAEAAEAPNASANANAAPQSLTIRVPSRTVMLEALAAAASRPSRRALRLTTIPPRSIIPTQS